MKGWCRHICTHLQAWAVTPSQWYVRHLGAREHQNTPSVYCQYPAFVHCKQLLPGKGTGRETSVGMRQTATPTCWGAHLAGERRHQCTCHCVNECLCRGQPDVATGAREVQDGEQRTELAGGPLSSVFAKEHSKTLRPLETSKC